MVSESSVKMLADDDLEKELGLLLREQQRQDSIDRERELNLFRSGSAPPTVDGSLMAIGGLFPGGNSGGISGYTGNGSFLSEEELRSDPAYLSYYYSNVNLNPRLPPPMVSKEDWRLTRRLQSGITTGIGGIGDRRKVDQADESLFSSQQGFNPMKEENLMNSRRPSEWLESRKDGLIGLSGLGLGGRKKSFADIIQEDLRRTMPAVSASPSRPSSRTFKETIDTLESVDSQLPHLQNESVSSTSLRSNGIVQVSGTQSSNIGPPSRNKTPVPQNIGRAPSPCIPPVGGGRFGPVDKRNINSPGPLSKSSDLVATFSGMSLSENVAVDDQNNQTSHINFEAGHLLPSVPQPTNSSYSDLKKSKRAIMADRKIDPPSNSNSYMKLSSGDSFVSSGTSSQQQKHGGLNVGVSGYSGAGYPLSPVGGNLASSNLSLYEDPSTFGAQFPYVSNLPGTTDFQGISMMANPNPSPSVQIPFIDPLYLQYLRTAEYPSMDRTYSTNTYVDLLELQKAYLGALLSPQKPQLSGGYVDKSNILNNGYYVNPGFGSGISYPTSPLASPLLPASPVGPGSPIRHNERNTRFSSGMRVYGGSGGAWHGDSLNNMDGNFGSSLLEEFKSSKTRCFELSDITGHVVEFSSDQYGSRFIQQKLETTTEEERNMVFEEIMPHALSLMTDVFGNYVIQKFFEHGNSTQRRELAKKLLGHVLTLSLQMYGCRVIQKAIEVVDLDLQTKMVSELEGQVMRCVRDQNGNHVIQKCIECIPQEAIEFIVTNFYDHVVSLSTHPYGCRVIQRVLEHCDDSNTQRIMMDEILENVCMLAQDQYGNYVVQHMLVHGKPHERSAIIKKLIGQIVQMSQQKFASNVVEKCLSYGDPTERQLLITEMLGTTDENEPLQAMMKDQFANYVVQKVLETCDDQQRELILSRIKVHLNALKKYTYGKHIVARVEKLVAAGERRLGVASSYAS